MARAMSAGTPMRFVGNMSAIDASEYVPASIALLKIAVLIAPGATAFTVIPVVAYSNAADLVKPTTYEQLKHYQN